MKNIYILILVSFFTFNSFAQDKKAVAEIYFKKEQHVMKPNKDMN